MSPSWLPRFAERDVEAQRGEPTRPQVGRGPGHRVRTLVQCGSGSRAPCGVHSPPRRLRGAWSSGRSHLGGPLFRVPVGLCPPCPALACQAGPVGGTWGLLCLRPRFSPFLWCLLASPAGLLQRGSRGVPAVSGVGQVRSWGPNSTLACGSSSTFALGRWIIPERPHLPILKILF